MASLRSSTRTTPRKTYTVDAFEGIQDLLQDSSESESEDEEQQAGQEGDEGEEEEESEEHGFKARAAEIEPDDDSMSGLDELGPVEEEEVDQRASDAGEADLDDSISIIEDVGPSNRITGTRMKRKRVKKTPPPRSGEPTYVRGVPAEIHYFSKPERLKWIFGPTKDDQAPVIKARNKWTNRRGFPSRTPHRDDRGGFAYNKTYGAEIENAESNWKWILEGGGREAFRQRQMMRPVTLAEVQPYLPTDFDLRTFVMGPVDQRKVYSMKTRQFVSMSAAFATTPQPQTNGHTGKLSSSNKNGFILNLGARVQSLDWAPNQEGPKQYLAATVLPFKRPDQPPVDAPNAPSFTPQPQHRSSIQVWEFSTNADNAVDDTKPPGLSLVLGTSIGDLKAIKWCPVPCKHREGLGLLACVSSDGAIRVLDVPPPEKTKRTNILVEGFAFECRPPNTVCTAFTWISSSRIAASCANGFVAVWDLDKALPSGNKNPRPTIYTAASTSYIMSIASCYPSFPHMIITTSLNGFITLMDLRQPHPNAGTTQTNRTRIGQTMVMWHDFAHAGFSVEDNQAVRFYPLRRWFTGLGTAKIKGHVTSMAVSPCHPYVLVGSTAGEVLGHNPVRRLFDGAKCPANQQRWFTHEWRRPTKEEREAAELAETEPASDKSGGVDMQTLVGKDGLSRITDGFKPQVAVLNACSAPATEDTDGAMFHTIYEEKTAVTALAWNPNLHVGGWAAAGMADGLLKVEDVSM
ncbi:hypothetical protein PRZ48_015176 [Zasmidium cellare]|uniref:Uncharacterized protein n=1 Tax=Zasmidium cellare TaxID=395010 RepID=A0ABR0DYB2_ZASCE|nr:hypothetical protein PRZ48_015176 [Zasmidium cellare]